MTLKECVKLIRRRAKRIDIPTGALTGLMNRAHCRIMVNPPRDGIGRPIGFTPPPPAAQNVQNRDLGSEIEERNGGEKEETSNGR